ncbi:MAG: peptidoglycan DD-metalloendopeptidase family protein, partial [Oscillospiraceae bacterium]|nr:peptidoglycan DD-metalloendopeptidase family protein [Oscillospiraceae bacterium]
SELQSQVNELSKQHKDLEKEISKLEGKLSTNLDSMEKIVAQKNTIDQEIFLLYSQMANLNEQIAAYSRLIADKQDELDAAQERLDALNKKNKERIRAMEEDGGLNYWSVLFKANDFADLLDRINMIEEIAAADRRRLKEMSEAAQEVEEAKQTLEEKRVELEQSKTKLEASQKKQEEKREEADKLLAKLVATGAEYQKLLDKAESNAEKLGDKLDDAKDDLKEAKYQQWLSTSVPTKPSGGGGGVPNTVGGKTWLTPCKYKYMSSAFGWRTHPIYGDRRFHYGIDLAASKGTPIVATRSGVVAAAAYDTSGGYYVTLDHQDGFTSKYLHMTHYIVSRGQKVSAGQVIGYVGSTGASTGAHLHFSILYNGEHVNPANYIKV